jgi:hypothetical protein
LILAKLGAFVLARLLQVCHRLVTSSLELFLLHRLCTLHKHFRIKLLSCISVALLALLALLALSY